MVPGRSKQVFKTWLACQPATWRENIEIVAMDGFTGFKSAAAEELPDARAVMDPFHVVHLAGDALDECRRRIQQELHHRRGRATDPLYKARRMLHTRSCLLTLGQQYQILDLFSGDEHVALEVTWSAYQNIINTYRAPDTSAGKALMQAEIDRLSDADVPRSLTEIITGSSELSVGDRVLRVEVEVLDDERTSTPAVVKDLGRCLTLPAAAPCRLIVVIGVICSSVWRASI